MNQGFLSVIINAIKSRVMPIVTKIRMYTSLSYLRTQVFSKIRDFFVRLLDIKPRDKKDYYTIGNWMVSKKLAYAVVMIVGTVSLIYIIMVRAPFGSFSGNDGIKTYKYTSLLLRMQNGKVRIKGRGGYLAYEGSVAKGYTEGNGTLFDREGSMVYIGNFEKSRFEGNGTMYYPGEIVQYTGDFHENLFHGEGKLYRRSGSMEYNGQFAAGRKEGHGILYDTAGSRVFEGEFSADDIAYSQIVGLATSDLADAYTGTRTVYMGNRYMAVYLSDIDAIYSIPVDNEELGNASTINEIYVLKDHINFGSKVCTSVSDITEVLGRPTYQGDSYATYPEIVGIYEMSKLRSVYSGIPEMDLTQDLKDLITVDSYDTDYQVYLYSFEKDGLLYSFLTNDDAGSGFDMYFVTTIMEGE